MNNEQNIAPNVPASGASEMTIGVEDIANLFGGTTEGASNKAGGKTLPDPNPIKVEHNMPEGGQPRNADEMAKMFQSKYDKELANTQLLQNEVTRLKEFEGFFNTIYEDEAVKQAFLFELAPERFKAQDPLAFVQEGLSREFGEDFKPDDNEVSVRGSKSWLYNKRADDMYEEALTKGKETPSGLKDLKKKRETAKNQQAMTAVAEKTKLMTDNTWSEAQFSNFLNWTNSLNLTNISHMYNWALQRKASASPTPDLASIPGGAPIMPGQLQREMAELFG